MRDGQRSLFIHITRHSSSEDVSQSFTLAPLANQHRQAGSPFDGIHCCQQEELPFDLSVPSVQLYAV